MKQLEKPMMWLVLVGGLLWGYEGLTGSELQEMIIGGTFSNFLEILVGVAAALLIVTMFTSTASKGKKK